MDRNRSCSPIYSHIHWTSLPVSVNGVSKTTARQIINNPLIIAPRMIEIRGLGEHENQQGVVGSSVRVTNPCDKRAPGFSWNSTGLSPVTTVRASSKPHPTHPTHPTHPRTKGNWHTQKMASLTIILNLSLMAAGCWLLVALWLEARRPTANCLFATLLITKNTK